MSVSGKVALFKRWFMILTGKNRVAVKQGVGLCYSIQDLKGYYNDLTGKVNSETLLDDNGIPINVVEGNRKVCFPISIFQYALGLWDLYLLNNDEVKKVHFLKICEWIYDNQRSDGSWDCFSVIGYKDVSVSSMGQGEAISVLVRAYKETKDKKWLEASKKAMSFMLKDINDGGTLYVNADDCIFEEYASLTISKKSVLNGWVFSLFGLIDYLKVVDDENVKIILEKSLDTLERKLSDYDIGYWSYYDISGHITSPAYHDLHIALLDVLYVLTNREIYNKYSKAWRKYQKNPVFFFVACMRKFVQKINESTEGVLVK